MKIIAIACLFTLATCANEERYLTLEEDQALREKCVSGCVIVPTPLFQQIIEALKGRNDRAV